MANRGRGGRFARGDSGAGGTASTPMVTGEAGITGVAGGPLAGRSLPDAGTLAHQAPYDEARPASGSLDEAPLACDPVYGMPARTQQEPAGALASYVGREPAPVGVAAGSYALGDARDLGAPVDNVDHGLPALYDGGYDFSTRLHQVGDQALADGLVQAGGSYLDYEPAPFVGG